MASASPKISIIIPVHNAEKYLDQCIESILSQTYQALQIICVNDGSSDGSLDVLEQYAAADSRITIESQSNQGVSAARNRGLEIATGEYIGFVDSDDWLEPTMVDTMLTALLSKKTDMAVCSVTQHDDDKKGESLTRRSFPNQSFLEPKECHEFVDRFTTGEFDFANWNKLFRRTIIENHKIRFNPDLQIGEDFLFNLRYITHARSFVILEAQLYHYRIHGGSLWHTDAETRWLEHCKRTNALIQSINKGEVQLTQELEIYLVQHSTIFTALPSLVQYFKRNNLLFTRKALDLLAMADHNWFWLPSQIRSLRLSLILHLLRGKYYRTLFTLWSLKTVA